MSWRTAALCCAVLSGAGCEVGKPLVDHVPPPDAGRQGTLAPCGERPACEPVQVTFLPSVRTFDVGDLPPCAVPLPLNDELDLRDGEAELRDCRLELVVFDALRVRLRGARLDNVVIDLSGPVRLEFVEDSSLSLVQIRAEPPGRGSMSLLLEDVTATDLIANGESMEIARSALAGASLSALRVEIGTSRLRHAWLRTTDLQATATWFWGSHLMVTNGTLAASELNITTVAENCQTLFLAGTEIVESQFGGCRDALRLHRATVRRSVLDGPIEADMTNILESVIGLDRPTRLWAWQSSVRDSNFCRLAEQARFADVSLYCAGCEGPFEEGAADVCHAADAELDADPNTCPAFAEPVPCEGEFPERRWPDDVSRDSPDGGSTSYLDGGVP